MDFQWRSSEGPIYFFMNEKWSDYRFATVLPSQNLRVGITSFGIRGFGG